MARKTTAADYLARGRTKGSGTDKAIVNGEEVKKELVLATQAEPPRLQAYSAPPDLHTSRRYTYSVPLQPHTSIPPHR